MTLIKDLIDIPERVQKTAQLDLIASFTLPMELNEQSDLGPLFRTIAQPESPQTSTQWIVLSRIIGYPVTRSRSLLPVIQRILNVDGYTVITIDPSSEIVTLQRELLCHQFGLSQKS
jgi:hypothetical protein